MAGPQIQYEQIAFHGGTSLHFSWRSPRLSEDLDFLIARSAADLGSIIELAGKKVAEAFRFRKSEVHGRDPGPDPA